MFSPVRRLREEMAGPILTGSNFADAAELRAVHSLAETDAVGISVTEPMSMNSALGRLRYRPAPFGSTCRSRTTRPASALGVRPIYPPAYALGRLFRTSLRLDPLRFRSPDLMVFAADYQSTCYWQDDTSALPEGPAALPQQVDVVIIGSGYTGLTAARERHWPVAGRWWSIAGPVAGGCSSRNGGQVAFSFKPDHPSLAAQYGRAVADGIYREGLAANAALAALATEEGLAFDFVRSAARRAYAAAFQTTRGRF
jgi:hypothetical protein